MDDHWGFPLLKIRVGKEKKRAKFSHIQPYFLHAFYSRPVVSIGGKVGVKQPSMRKNTQKRLYSMHMKKDCNKQPGQVWA
jgi:hypothetical protein